VTRNDVTWPHVTRSDLEVTSFDWKSSRSGCRKPISHVWGTFELQDCNSQEVAVTWQKWRDVTSCDRKWPGSESFDRKSPGSGHRRPISQVWGRFCSYMAVTHRKWPSCNTKWCHMTLYDRKWRDQKSHGSCCRRPVNLVLGTFELVQGCIS